MTPFNDIFCYHGLYTGFSTKMRLRKRIIAVLCFLRFAHMKEQTILLIIIFNMIARYYVLKRAQQANCATYQIESMPINVLIDTVLSSCKYLHTSS